MSRITAWQAAEVNRSVTALISKYTAPFLYVSPSGLNISHMASVIPAKAKFAIRKPPPALRKSLNERIENAVKSITAKQITRKAIEKNRFISGRKIISE